MFNFNIYLENLNKIKKNKKTSITNNYFYFGDIKEISQRADSVLLANDRCVLLHFVDNGVNRVFYHLSAIECIESLVSLLDSNLIKKPCIFECVGRKKYLDDLKINFGKNNIDLYTSMSRWRTNSVSYIKDSRQNDIFRFAQKQDLKKIQSIFGDVFDPYISHLPTDEKLVRLINDKLVYCYDLNDDIVAVCCCEKIGDKSIYFYQEAVAEKYRGCGIGTSMLNYVLKDNNFCIDYSCWIEENNGRSKEMHKKFGFKRDGLKSYIFIYR